MFISVSLFLNILSLFVINFFTIPAYSTPQGVRVAFAIAIIIIAPQGER